MLRTCPSKQYIHSRESKSQDLIPKLPPNLSTTVSDDLSLQCLTTTTLSLLPRYKHVFWCFMTTRGATIYIGLELESIMLMVQFKYQMHSGKLAFQGRMVHPPLFRGIWSFLSLQQHQSLNTSENERLCNWGLKPVEHWCVLLRTWPRISVNALYREKVHPHPEVAWAELRIKTILWKPYLYFSLWAISN